MRTPLVLRLFPVAAVSGCLLLTTACSKDPEAAQPASVTSAEDQGSAEEASADAADLIAAAAPADITLAAGTAAEVGEFARVAGPCATRTYEPATRTLTIDFGTTNCQCPGGKLRRGKLVVVFSGSYQQQGSKMTVTLVDYYVNDQQHTGTRTYTYLGGGSYSLDVQNASIVTSTGTHSWTSQRTYTRTAGFGTRTILDDTYTVTGSAAGTNRRGISYTATIEQPLVKVFTPGCVRHFIAGTVSIANIKEQTLLLNYDPTGTEACDNLASVTVNGKTKLVRLR